jgi:hypothetical protein
MGLSLLSLDMCEFKAYKAERVDDGANGYSYQSNYSFFHYS